MALASRCSSWPAAPLSHPAPEWGDHGDGCDCGCSGLSLCPRLSVHMQETDRPGELPVRRGDSLGAAPRAEAPAAAQPGERDPPVHGDCPQAPATESGQQSPEGGSVCPPLPARSSDGGAEAEDKPGCAAGAALGPSAASRGSGEDAGAQGQPQDTSPGAGHPEPRRDLTLGGLGGAEAGGLVLGKPGRCQGICPTARSVWVHSTSSWGASLQRPGEIMRLWGSRLLGAQP